MEDEYGSDFLTIVDEDGKEYELEILASIDYNGVTYHAVVPAGDEGEDGSLEVNILKEAEEDGEPLLLTIDDDEELETVYRLIMDSIYEEDSSE